MTYDALCHLLDDLEVPQFLRVTIEILFREGSMDEIAAILNDHAADPSSSNCQLIDVQALEIAPNAFPEAWAQDAAERTAKRLGLPAASGLLFVLARAIEEEVDRHDWLRARALDSQFPRASEEWTDQPPPDYGDNENEEDENGNAPT